VAAAPRAAMAELHEWPNQHIQQPVTLSQFN